MRTNTTEAPGDHHRPSPHLLLFLLLTAVALFLRWYRLDLISFRYDMADALFRARETLTLGHPPLTGIINSLGFRNPGGFVWAILPPLLLTPRVEVVTAWVGFLTVTALWPLYRIGRRYLSPAYLWAVPCTLYAAHPFLVFGGRNVWAQSLMPAAGAWALWWLLVARDPACPAAVRGRAMLGALAMLAVSVTIHLSGAAYLIAAVLLLLPALRRKAIPARWLAATAAALLLVGLTLLPSVLDWRESRHSTRPKAAHVLKYESLAGPPPSLPARLNAAVSGQFGFLASTASSGGIELQLTNSLLLTAALADLALLLLAFAGLIRAGLVLRGKVLLLWLAVPALLGFLFIPRLNTTYFAPVIPAIFLLIALGLGWILGPRESEAAAVPDDLSPRKDFGSRRPLISWKAGSRAPAVISLSIAVLCLTVYALFQLSAMAAINKSRIAHGQYYIPLADQERLARRFHIAGVPAGQINHLSGPWFQTPYDYLHTAVAGALPESTTRRGRAPSGTAVSPWALLDDTLLRRSSEGRVRWLQENLSGEFGTVRYEIVPDRVRAQALEAAFFAVPMEP